MDNSPWQTAADIDFLGAYTLLGKPMIISTANNTTWMKESPCLASAFLGKCASITVVDLIQEKKLGSWKFLESNLTKARFEII